MSGAQFSAIGAMRTGNMVLDMLVAMLVPCWLEKLASQWLGRDSGGGPFCTRSISFMSVGSSLAGREHKNNMLQKAVALR